MDEILIGLIALSMLRGWARGLIREALDVVTLVAGAVLAFRLAGPVGSTLAAMSGMSPEVTEMVAGAGLFVGISIGAAVAARLIHSTIRRLPGLTFLNRLGGAALGAVYGLVLVTVAVTLLSVLPMPPPLSSGLASSDVASSLTRPSGPVQRLLATASGNRIPQALLAIEQLVGSQAVVLGGSGLPVPAVGDEITRLDRDFAAQVFDLINRERIVAGVEPMAWSNGLGVAAVVGAQNRYRGDDAGDLSVRVASAGIPSTDVAEVAALAATPAGAVAVLLESPASAVTLLDPETTRFGVGVVSGPFGNVVAVVVSR